MVLKHKNQHSVLIVDDDADIIDLLKESLEDLSFNVFTATNGLEALQFMNCNKVDCIVTDVSMPQMNGVEFIKKLQERQDFTPFFFITGYLDFPDENLNIFKPRSIIFKPFDFEEAAMLVKNHLMRI
ncbi:MAG: response regulator [Bacteriovorax sp.]|jgi:DNA-binding NtrC family response regulator